MATMTNKQYANKTSVDTDKLNDLLIMVHTNHHSLTKELERMTHNYQEAVKQIGILEAENDKLKISQKYKDGKNYQKENEKLKYQIDMLKDEIDTLQSDITEHPDYQELVDEHEFEMDKLKGEIDTLNKREKHRVKQITELKEENETLENEVDELRDGEDSFRDGMIDGLQAEITELKQEIDNLNKREKNKIKQITQLKAKLDEYYGLYG